MATALPFFDNPHFLIFVSISASAVVTDYCNSIHLTMRYVKDLRQNVTD